MSSLLALAILNLQLSTCFAQGTAFTGSYTLQQNGNLANTGGWVTSGYTIVKEERQNGESCLSCISQSP
jgi:hypothetical protein